MTSASSTLSKRRSSGISRNTGPGTLVVATRKADCTYSPRRRACGTDTAHLVIGFIRSTWAMSCSPPMSWKKRGACPPITIIGMFARQAVATPCARNDSASVHRHGVPLAAGGPELDLADVRDAQAEVLGETLLHAYLD